jgi:acyl-coenzyme A synthetase/AMP-(fatty) acid ligase
LLYWRGRKRDQFQWAKLFCNPFDIEDQIRSQFSLQNVVVAKVNTTSPNIGVFIEKAQDMDKKKEEEIIQVVRQWIADSIAPVTLKTYERFPRTSNGKVIRAEVLKLLS